MVSQTGSQTRASMSIYDGPIDSQRLKSSVWFNVNLYSIQAVTTNGVIYMPSHIERAHTGLPCAIIDSNYLWIENTRAYKYKVTSATNGSWIRIVNVVDFVLLTFNPHLTYLCSALSLKLSDIGDRGFQSFVLVFWTVIAFWIHSINGDYNQTIWTFNEA